MRLATYLVKLEIKLNFIPAIAFIWTSFAHENIFAEAKIKVGWFSYPNIHRICFCRGNLRSHNYRKFCFLCPKNW